MPLSSFKSLLLPWIQFGIHEKGTVSADFFKKRVEIVTREKKRFCSTPFQTSPASLSYLTWPLFSLLSTSLPSSLSPLLSCLFPLFSLLSTSLPSSLSPLLSCLFPIFSSLLFLSSISLLLFLLVSFSSSLLLLVSFSYLSSSIFPLLFPHFFFSSSLSRIFHLLCFSFFISPSLCLRFSSYPNLFRIIRPLTSLHSPVSPLLSPLSFLQPPPSSLKPPPSLSSLLCRSSPFSPSLSPPVFSVHSSLSPYILLLQLFIATPYQIFYMRA
jgi:hypothetical protein